MNIMLCIGYNMQIPVCSLWAPVVDAHSGMVLKIMLLPPSVPSPPLSLMAVDVGSSTVSLTWSPPTEQNGILLYYRLVARQNGNNTETLLVYIPAKTSSSNTSTSDMVEGTANRRNMSLANTAGDLPAVNISVAYTLSGLTPRTDYVITIEAGTSVGYGNRSDELHIQTAAYTAGVCVCMRA